MLSNSKIRLGLILVLVVSQIALAGGRNNGNSKAPKGSSKGKPAPTLPIPGPANPSPKQPATPNVECTDNGRVLPIDNDAVLKFKVTTKSGFLARAHVSGVVTRVFPDKNGHDHFEISIGSTPDAVLEVVYNSEFGDMPVSKPGDQVEACGDYITSNAPNNGYPASPSGAIIHWVHENPREGGHDDGYVMLNGKLYGYDPKPGADRRGLMFASDELYSYAW